METAEIFALMQQATLYNQKFEMDFQETHISWVLFTADFALKIKKPISLSFLDFSTLELRKHFCEQEVKLNSRFSDIYLAVEAFSKDRDTWVIGNGDRQVSDYGVVMKRQNHSLQMDRLLSKNQVGKEAIIKLARQVANFHKDAVVISTPFDLERAKELFRDLRSILAYFETVSDGEFGDVIENAIRLSDEFLTENQDRFENRAQEGNVRDVHGDLHSRNIFLTSEPVLFDCVEFNDRFRQIDVWYEIAFLCMDMEFHGHRSLSEVFFKEYTFQKGELVTKRDQQIFTYFKMLRANIRAKVLALQASESNESKSEKEMLQRSVRYLVLMQEYMEELNER